MRFGLQMFGINSIFTKDKEGALKRFQKAGLRYMEPCFNLAGIEELASHAWTEEEFEINYPLLQKYGFSIYSCHLFPTNLVDDVPKLVEMANKYGIKQYVVSVPAINTMAQYEEYANTLNAAGKLLKENDLELLLHNAKDESVIKVDGISLYEWILQRTKEYVGAQPDVGWLIYGETDPEAFLWRNKEQVKSLHYKDMKKINPDGDMSTDNLTETGVGKGLVDMEACFQFAREIEVIQLMDQDTSEDDFIADVEFVGGKLNSLNQCRSNSSSILCTMNIETGEVTKLHRFDNRVVEAPNWHQQNPDHLYYNSDGRIYRYSISEDKETLIDSGECTNCNNDHVLSPDGKMMAVSHSVSGWMSQIYTFPIEGGEAKLITPNSPSFLHGWSPDGKDLVYCAFRSGWTTPPQADIYFIPSEGGEEAALTENQGFNDGSEYAPNNEEVWFTSTRTGLMQAFKMNRDGSNQTQMTFRDRNNWFPHVSPDGKKVVYLSYSKYGLDAAEHLPNMNVELGLMNYDGSDDHVILEFYGGQGSINVNSWHPDSKQFAFVMYELNHK